MIKIHTEAGTSTNFSLFVCLQIQPLRPNYQVELNCAGRGVKPMIDKNSVKFTCKRFFCVARNGKKEALSGTIFDSEQVARVHCPAMFSADG